MAFKHGPAAPNRFNAGEHVEVIDACSRLHGKIGIVAFFVDDNIYVRFGHRRWSPAKMLFSDQLRPTNASQPQPSRGGEATFLQKLRHSLQKIALARKPSIRR